MKIISVSSFFQRASASKHQLQSGIKTTIQPPGLARVAYWSERQLPPFVRRCPIAMKYLALLRALDWANLPWRDTTSPHPGPVPASPIPYIAAFLIKLDQQHRTMGQLRQYLVDHPALTWSLGFPLHMCI
jgi:hypothetical protein